MSETSVRAEVLASWNAPAATELFEQLVTLLEVRELAHAAACWADKAATIWEPGQSQGRRN